MVKTTSNNQVGNVSVYNNTTVVTGSAACQRSGCLTPHSVPAYDERAQMHLCQYCRQQITRRIRRAQKKDKSGRRTYESIVAESVKAALCCAQSPQRVARRTGETIVSRPVTGKENKAASENKTAKDSKPAETVPARLLGIVQAFSEAISGLVSELTGAVAEPPAVPRLAANKATNDKLLRFYDVCEQADIITYRVDGEVKSRHCVWDLKKAEQPEDIVLSLSDGPSFTAQQLLTGKFDRSTYRMTADDGAPIRLVFGVVSSMPVSASSSL